MEYSFESLPIWAGSAKSVGEFSSFFEKKFKVTRISDDLRVINLLSLNNRISIYLDFILKRYSVVLDSLYDDEISSSFSSISDIINNKSVLDLIKSAGIELSI